jgi:hypothetical protein
VALAVNIVGVVGAVASGTITGVTVTVVEVENIPAWAVTVVVPVDDAVKIPVAELIEPIESFEFDQVVVAKMYAPY